MNEVVALLDPDMLFLRPLTSIIKGSPYKLYNKNLYYNKKNKNVQIKEFQNYVVSGKPVAQRYGLGAPWTDDKHKKFNRKNICGKYENSPCMNVNEHDGEE